MKKYSFLLVLVITLLVGCKEQPNKDITSKNNEETKAIEPISDKTLENAIIYEANIRQYSPEGTFNEFTKDIPQLKELGVKVVWLMPIFPISETNRKATGGLMVHDIKDPEEQKKYLGSYYAVSDFTKINPEFGTIEDFRKLVKTAHQNGIYIILDWVPNHTGWDHKWLTTNPEYYTQKEGKVIHPEGTDWTDVADLNYENEEMKKEMIADMMYWVAEENVDGFRCDVAGSVPTNFWEEAIPQLRAKKELFMLAEAWEPELLKGELFDMAYAWDGHHLMNDLAKGKKGLKDFEAYMSKIAEQYEADDILMNFVTNHDENSWNGTIKERMGDASELMTVLSYIKPGMPLIYTGQEYDLDHRLLFFEKDSIPKTKGKTWELLKKLGELKNRNVALNGGKAKAQFDSEIINNESVLMIHRSKNDKNVYFMGNFSNEEQQVVMPKGSLLNYMTNTKVEFNKDDKLILKPFEYKIFTD
jgi:1,4-alpha-glucan branching enzyme